MENFIKCLIDKSVPLMKNNNLNVELIIHDRDQPFKKKKKNPLSLNNCPSQKFRCIFCIFVQELVSSLSIVAAYNLVVFFVKIMTNHYYDYTIALKIQPFKCIHS